MKTFTVIIFLLIYNFTYSQFPEMDLTRVEVEGHLRFLASDELGGRKTGEPGNDVAARYIAEQFRGFGVMAPKGHEEYFQRVPFKRNIPPASGTLQWADTLLTLGKEMIIMSGSDNAIEAEVIFAGHAWKDSTQNDLEGLDLRDKIVLAQMGKPNAANPMENFGAARSKIEFLREAGAIALIDIYNLQFPWRMLLNYLQGEQMSLDTDQEDESDQSFKYILASHDFSSVIKRLNDGEKLTFEIEQEAAQEIRITSNNVVGFIQGTDPVLQDEYILLSAHYDHIGIDRRNRSAESGRDSIFNGARDNAFGTTALLMAAKAFAKSPPRRSIILLACTGEEEGLLGSQYYSDNPVFPLNRTIFNLNTDGAGYNDTSIVSIFGLDRMDIGMIMEKGAAVVGLQVFGDPAPEQNLFERSDNVSFARKGIPSPTYSPGFKEFDQEINRYYHQLGDEPKSIDFDYLLRFCKSFVYTARLFADQDSKPAWTPGDNFEKAYNELYGLN